jgi:hypothetical protein
MSDFEDHLWDEFVREHGAGLAQMSRPTATYHRRPRPGLVAGTGLGLAGAGAALALALGATTASPAFAVTRNHDGTVTIWIKTSSGIAGANAELHQLGIRAEVMTQVPADCDVRAVRRQALTPSPGIANARWTINPRKVPAGQTLVLTADDQVWNCGRALRVSPAPGTANS